MYKDEFEVTSEHITVIYDKLDSLERKMDYEFEKVGMEFRRTHIELKELKGMLSELLKHTKSETNF